ncbi:MAG: alanine/ornithine racemase family PLP-dependent enzyme [Bacteroidia bacterium]
MAYITIDIKKLEHNFQFLDKHFKAKNTEWAIVTKLLCGHMPTIEFLVQFGAKELCDSRLSNIQKIKEAFPSVQTVYIKPPAKLSISNIVKYADVSFNTEFQTLVWLSEEAVKQNKIHKVIIMIELGDLREGVLGEDLLDFYGKVFELPNINVTGIGTNLNCLNGVMPSEDKLIQLSLYKQLIEAKFNCEIPWVTGGTSVVLPLLFNNQLPKGINHFRIGEMLYFGNDLVNNAPVEGMFTDVMRLYGEVIEISEKPLVPYGVIDESPSGHSPVINADDYGKTSVRAILDLGLLDTLIDQITPLDENIKIAGGSSDMLVLDLKHNKKNYKIGDVISFSMEYMAALGVMSSDYIEKRLINYK